MWNPVDAWQQRRARRRYMPHVQRARTGRTAKVAALAALAIIGMAALFELRGGTGAESELAALARAQGEDALDLIESAARSHRLVFLSAIPTAPAPRRFVSDAIERIASVSGLDLVVLDIDANEQPYIDRYLATTPEDASILVARPRAVLEGDGASRSFLDIYRTVWRINQELGASRRIRIVAAAPPGWPPERATSPASTAKLFGQRADHMMKAVMDRALSREPGARVLFFVDGLQTLKSGGGRVQTGGATPIEMTWLAAQLRQRFPADVYTILVDAQPSRSISPEVAAYRGTEFNDTFRRGDVEPRTALTVTPLFGQVSRTPIRTAGTTGIEFTLEPRYTPLTQLADAYIYLGN